MSEWNWASVRAIEPEHIAAKVHAPRPLAVAPIMRTHTNG